MSAQDARPPNRRSWRCARKKAHWRTARELDLEVARRVDSEKERLAEQQDLRLKEKDKLIDDLRHALDEARRKSDQGSQQRQGEPQSSDWINPAPIR